MSLGIVVTASRCVMNRLKENRSVACLVVAFAWLALTPIAFAQWPQWGGKNRDFVAEAKDLAPVWPEGGPRRIWTRALGPGFASIAFDNDRLYTLQLEANPNRGSVEMGPGADDNSQREIVIALDAQTGKTLWEYNYAAPWPTTMDTGNFNGPNATPLIHDGRVYTFGLTGKVHCIDQKTGKPIWSHDVVAEFGAKSPGYGFASSPLLYKNSLILPVGGPGVGAMAFDAVTGQVLWKKHDFADFHSSPIIVRVDGVDEIVFLTGGEVVGMSPATGDIEWRYPFKSGIMTPLFDGTRHLFVGSSEFGSRSLKLTKKDGKVEEVWSQKEMRVDYSNAVRVGGLIIGSGGWDEKYYLTAVDAETGSVAWQQDGFNMANMVHADGKLIILDDGVLSLAVATREKLEVNSKFRLFKSIWSNPIIVGQRLYARNHDEIVALDLGADSAEGCQPVQSVEMGPN